MKFSATTAFIAIASLASPAFAKSSRRGNGFTPSTGFHQLASRQAVTLNICENVPLQAPVNAQVCTRDGEEVSILPGLDLTGLVCSVVGGTEVDVEVSAGICLCLAGGVLTDDSVADIRGLVDLGGPAVELLLNPLGGVVGLTVDQLVDALIGDGTNLLNVGTTDCVYPDGAIPNSCDVCTFACPDGQTPCGDQCIAEGDTCASGIPGRKRNLLNSKSSNFLCAQGQTACSVPSSRFFTLGGYECVDTQADIESCGGCTFAFAGQAQGQDCTAISNAIDVTCNTGSCVVQACSEGFEPNFDESKCVAVGTNLGFVIENKRSIDLKLSPLTDLIKNLTGITIDPTVIELDLLKDDIVNIEKRALNLDLNTLTDLIKNLTGVDVDVKNIDIDLLNENLISIEKRTTEDDSPILNLDLESITKLLGVDLNDIDIELLKTKLAKIQKRSEDEPIVNLNLESITKLLGVDLNDIDIELLKHKLAKIQ